MPRRADQKKKEKPKRTIFNNYQLYGCSVSKESACNTWDAGLIPGSQRSSGKGNGYPLQYYCLKNPMTEEPGSLQSMGLQRVWPNWSTNNTHSAYISHSLIQFTGHLEQWIKHFSGRYMIIKMDYKIVEATHMSLTDEWINKKGGRNGKLLFNRYGVSVVQDTKSSREGLQIAYK